MSTLPTGEAGGEGYRGLKTRKTQLHSESRCIRGFSEGKMFKGS